MEQNLLACFAPLRAISFGYIFASNESQAGTAKPLGKSCVFSYRLHLCEIDLIKPLSVPASLAEEQPCQGYSG
jgi:hypothetical protein